MLTGTVVVGLDRVVMILRWLEMRTMDGRLETMSMIKTIHPIKVLVLCVVLLVVSAMLPNSTSAQTSDQWERQRRDDERKRFEQFTDESRRRHEEESRVNRRAAALNFVAVIEGDRARGAGIIFGRGKDRLYIATANHVVRPGAVETMSLTVKLRSQPNIALSARLLGHRDKDLDLAVLSVEGLESRGVRSCSWYFGFLGDIRGGNRRVELGKAVYPVGHPSGMEWFMPVAADRVSGVTGDNIAFQSAVIAPGHSGGALLDESGYLVGMILKDQPPIALAISLNRILPVLKAWGYPIALFDPGAILDTTLRHLVHSGDHEALKRAFADCGTNTRDESRSTALHHAAEMGKLDTIRFLFQSGADVNVLDGYNRTPLDLASDYNRRETVDLLVSHGALSGHAVLRERKRNR